VSYNEVFEVVEGSLLHLISDYSDYFKTFGFFFK